jgi:hypothetical protein
MSSRREFLARASARLLVLATADGAVLILLTVATGSDAAMLAVSLVPEPHRSSWASSTRCYTGIPGWSTVSS